MFFIFCVCLCPNPRKHTWIAQEQMFRANRMRVCVCSGPSNLVRPIGDDRLYSSIFLFFAALVLELSKHPLTQNQTFVWKPSSLPSGCLKWMGKHGSRRGESTFPSLPARVKVDGIATGVVWKRDTRWNNNKNNSSSRVQSAAKWSGIPQIRRGQGSSGKVVLVQQVNFENGNTVFQQARVN